jgi:cyclase
MAPRLPRSRHFRIETLDRGVYAAIATEGGHGLCNSGIVDLGEMTAVYDTMLTPTAGADLCRTAERLTGRRPDVVINSHWHGDHIRGSAAFAPVRVVSSRANRALIARRGPKQLADDRRLFPRELARVNDPSSPIPPRDRPMYRGWFEGALATPATLPFLLPDVTFDSEVSLEGSRRTLSVLTYGGGHSPSDVFARLTDERTVFLGDLVNIGMHPSLSDGFPSRWIEILGRIRALRPAVVLPGHGEVGGLAEIREVESYLQDLQRMVRRRIHRSDGGDDLAGLQVPDRYADWKFADFFLPNLRRVRSMLRREPSRGPR